MPTRRQLDLHLAESTSSSSPRSKALLCCLSIRGGGFNPVTIYWSNKACSFTIWSKKTHVRNHHPLSVVIRTYLPACGSICSDRFCASYILFQVYVYHSINFPSNLSTSLYADNAVCLSACVSGCLSANPPVNSLYHFYMLHVSISSNLRYVTMRRPTRHIVSNF